MFKKIMTANRGDQWRSGAGTQPGCMARAARTDDFDAEINHV
ncbi:MAG TPA: hypothetical protein PKA16_05250 [Ottowia sp.]|nr:hypothetical protein [Ottowia sp.]HMN20780.1 hypothetical protein [Ottowia sp.]